MTNQWLHIKNWHIIYISCHCSIITTCYLSHVFFYTLRICWYSKKKFNWKLLCICKHSKGGNVFSKYTNKRLSHFYVYGYNKTIINVSKNNNTLFTHLWTIHSIYLYLVSTYNKWMVAYEKLNSSLCFPPPFNYNQCLLNLPCFFKYMFIHYGFFNTLTFFFNWQLLCMLKHSKRFLFFSQYMDKRYVSRSMIILR
jgi:hypothetical protein